MSTRSADLQAALASSKTGDYRQPARLLPVGGQPAQTGRHASRESPRRRVTDAISASRSRRSS